MINAQISPLSVTVDTQDLIDDLIKYKERALCTHIMKVLPKFMLNTPGMKRRAKAVDTLLERIQSVHTPAQRAGCPRNLADDWLSLHASDPQFVPESNLRFALSAALIASVYLGDALSFAVYAMASQPALYDRIRSEADALFENGDPDGEAFNPAAIDVTHRFLMECMRMYPIVPHVYARRDECVRGRGLRTTSGVADLHCPDGSALHGRRLPRPLHHSILTAIGLRAMSTAVPARTRRTGWARTPVSATRWMELQLAVNVLMIAHYFTLEVSPRKLQAAVQPAAVDETEQEAEVPHRRTEARTARLTHYGRRRPSRHSFFLLYLPQ